MLAQISNLYFAFPFLVRTLIMICNDVLTIRTMLMKVFMLSHLPVEK